MLNTLASLGEFLGGLAVIGGVIFAVIQIRHYRQQRRDAAALTLMQTLQSRPFMVSFRLLGSVRDGITAPELRAQGAEYEEAAIAMVSIYETIGLAVYRDIAHFDLVRELTGGVILAMWRKLAIWAEELRRERSHERYAEWFQWLAERIEEHEAREATLPAHKKLATWEPRH
ncbi:MAG: DUF4760 domain-containing protein [Gemmatimonadota bacterium]|nr:MAG: DUF4760 domain-containing protein [Gemmatimonadota bacterium]